MLRANDFESASLRLKTAVLRGAITNFGNTTSAGARFEDSIARRLDFRWNRLDHELGLRDDTNARFMKTDRDDRRATAFNVEEVG